MLEERVQPAELFEFFEENADEYAELTRILDYNGGDALTGRHSEKYFKDCVTKLKLEELDKRIKALTSLIEAESDGQKRKALAVRLNGLIKQKEKLKSGER